MTNLNEMKVKELKEMAKNLKIKDWSKLKKDDLITEIAFAIADNEQDKPEDVEEVKADEVIVEEDKASQNEPETKELVPMPGTEGDWGEKHWGNDVDQKPEKKPRGKMIEYNGKSQSLNAWAKELGMPGQTLFARIYISKWPIEKAFTTPSRRKKSEEEA